MTEPVAKALAITCRGLVYIYRLGDYDVVALSGVDLDIAAGESVALVGPSGSGKSTLVGLMSGLLRPAAGRLLVGGHDLVKAADDDLQRLRATEIGMLLQGRHRNLIAYLSAGDNIRFAQRGVPRRDRGGLTPARELLALVGLTDPAAEHATVAALTPGQRQQLAVAVGVAGGAGLLLADEPTAQLDAEARDAVLTALLAVHEAGHTVVVVTHDPEVGAHMGRTITIRGGRVGSEGRRGEDFLVMGAGGTVHLPPDIAEGFGPGALLRVSRDDDGVVRLWAVEDREPKGAT